MNKISGVYRITNTITGDFYIGSSKNVKLRWAFHKYQSTWKRYPNSQLYNDMKNYGVDKFELQILAEVEIEQLKKTEQEFIETLKPTYNQMNAKGWDIERYKERLNKYNKSDKGKESQNKYNKSDKGKESRREYRNQLCCYNGETLTLNALSQRFMRKGLSNPAKEAKKYLKNNNPIEFYDVYP